MRISPRWQVMCSSAGVNRFRLSEGSASKSRLKGRVEIGIISYNNSQVLLVPARCTMRGADRMMSARAFGRTFAACEGGRASSAAFIRRLQGEEREVVQSGGIALAGASKVDDGACRDLGRGIIRVGQLQRF